MKITLSLIVILLLSSCMSEYAVEDELYACIEQEFANNSMDLSQELDTLEMLFLEAGLIKSAAPEDYRNYYQENINQGINRFLESPFRPNKSDKVQLSFDNLERCALRKFDGETYDRSKFGQISNMIDTMVNSTGQITFITVAEAHLKVLSPDDFEHPFYRANILLSLQSIYFQKYIRNENYLREIPKKVEMLNKTW